MQQKTQNRRNKHKKKTRKMNGKVDVLASIEIIFVVQF